jgi:nidogen-like/HYR domain-containing protein
VEPSTGIGGTCCDNQTATDSYGNIFLVNINSALNGIELYTSTDGGATFTLTQQIDTGDVDQPSVAAGANMVWVSWTKAGTLFARGAPVTGLGNIGTFNAEQRTHGTPGPAGPRRLPNANLREVVPGSNNGDCTFGDIAILPNGSVVVDCQTNTQIFVSRDTDGLGANGFGAQALFANVGVDKFFSIPPQPNRTIDAEANLAVDLGPGAFHGRVYLTFTNLASPNTTNTDIFLSHSNDGGATWTGPIKINDDNTTTSQFFSEVAVDPLTGNILATWLDPRGDANNHLIRAFGAISTDGGQTWGANFPISAGQSGAAADGNPNEFGDYAQPAFFNGRGFAIWPDNSNTTGNNPDGTNHFFDMNIARINGPFTGVGAIISSGGCLNTVLPANDDGFSPLVNLPFTINFFGTDYSSLFVNNNGNTTFNGGLSTFTPQPIVANGVPMIAPFWADVDTRGGSNTTQYGPISAGDTQVGGHPAFCVNWINVGYYSQHTDKLNSFQEVIVDRSDTGVGNFDIIFNYNTVNWETGDASGGVNGFGGVPVRIGYTNGDNASFELPGSAQTMTFLDSNPATGLIFNSINSQQPGRYIFPVRNGAATGHSLSGHVWAENPGNPVAGAVIQACPVPFDTPCRVQHSNADGFYIFNNLPDSTSGQGIVDHNWNLVTNPPAGSSLNGSNDGPVPVAGADVPNFDITLQGPEPIPDNASIDTPTFGQDDNGNPTVYWHDPITVVIEDCVGGTGTAALALDDGSYEQTVNLGEDGGLYTAVFDAPYPHHGNFHVSWTIHCPDNTDSTDGFDGYIDPSGFVKTTGGAPIPGATVTLFRSDDPGGPFVQVPNGSAIMSPSNQANPDATDGIGHFGWDVLAGYYKVRAQHAGCTAVGGTPDYAESGVLTIPPPVTDLQLTLDCTSDVTAPSVIVPSDKTVEATGAGGAAVTFAAEVSASDVDDAAGAVNCVPSSGSTFPIGLTQVTCTSTDTHSNTGSNHFNVTVHDATAPNLTVPPNQTADATSPSGGPVTFSPAPSANDLVDGALTPVCAPASGSAFPNGDTVVHCHATDAHGNTANGQFTVHVRGPLEQAPAIKALLNSFTDVAASIRKSLGKKMDTVVKDLNKGPKGTKAACSQVKSFTRTVTKDIPKKIPPAEGNQLVARAGTLKSAIGCA